MTAAAAPLPGIVRAAARAPLDSPTPCAGWDLAALVRHQLYWAPFLAAAGRRADGTPVAATEQDVPLADWAAALDAAHADIVAAWTDGAAWTGTTTMGGPDPMPAPVIGNMVLGELVVHGWDLARTAGTPASWPDDVLGPVLDAVREMGPMGREMGIFGPEVEVPADAPLLDKIVAATGRTP
ncbi:TIGR03086 family protein [Pseudonocardia sp. S2-4]|uniref:TIGR03086 family protein n=2 Tax=Pseudonocardia humida TaxID=2800819 RepID=A0ABT1A493_9PSEU|nr:TIGR03086 family protein [Pseudonocardia humida]